MMRKVEHFRKEQDKGFDISFDTGEDLVTVRVWGLWDETLAGKFEHEFQLKIQGLPLNDESWNLLMDFTYFSNNSKQIERTFSDILLFAKQKGMGQQAIVAKHAVMPHLLDTLAQTPDLKINFFFQGKSDARQWLLSA